MRLPFRAARLVMPAALLTAGLLLATASVLAQPSDPVIEVAEVDGLLDRSMAGYLERVLDRAAADNAEVVVVQLRSAGSLGDAADRLTARLAASPVPVVVWVGPAGVEAAGGAARVAEAAHVTALAPDATLDGRTEDALLAEGAIDFVAPSLPAVLVDLHEHHVVVGGTERVLDLDPARAVVRYHSPTLLQRFLHAASDPLLAYLLILAGGLCLAFEVFQPGFGVAGVAGIPLAALGLYGLAVLPTRWLAVAAFAAGLALLAADLALGRLGVLTAGGGAAFAAGSWLLYRPPFALPVWLVALATVGVVVYYVLVLTTVLRAQGHRAVAGADETVGKVGVVRSVLNPEGHVFVDGALWRARAPDDAGKVRTGTAVRVVGVEEHTLQVELADDAR
jgi:membrane-bound serine protease (ClpP class)